MELSRIERDDFLDAVTLRIKTSCLDCTVQVKTGELVGGSDRHPRRACEYWTLTRLRDTKSGAAETCPRCGVARGPVETAFCAHCGSRLYAISGRWELAFIEQVDGYLLGKPRSPGDQSSWRRL